jgi:hypothetical protein
MFLERISLITVSLLTKVNKDMGLSYVKITKKMTGVSTYQWVLI